MKCVNIVAFILCIRYTLSQFLSVNQKQQKTHCDSSLKNSLVEHFFNIIFSEFHATPPVCVCVQMCAGQSTYCYPHGCLKRDDLKRVDSPQAMPHARTDKKQYMFVVDEKDDFLEKTYVNEVAVPPVNEQLNDMLPDLFKDKYSMFIKYKKLPSVQLRYSLREQVRNMKSDLFKTEPVDLSKTRWPMNKKNLNGVNGHKIHSKTEAKTFPLIGKTNFFMTMLPASEIADYPPRYFKREIAKTLNDDEANVKSFYLFENLQNDTDFNATETISLETLIDNLVNNSFKTKLYDTKNETQLNNVLVENTVLVNKSENNPDSESEIENTESESNKKRTSDGLTLNETINVISTNETNDKNKYLHKYVSSSTKKFNEMIINLSKRIDKQNNTSMEVAKRIVDNFGEEKHILPNNTESLKDLYNTSATENMTEIHKTETSKQTSTTSATFDQVSVTMKNRQRRARKSQNSKINTY